MKKYKLFANLKIYIVELFKKAVKNIFLIFQEKRRKLRKNYVKKNNRTKRTNCQKKKIVRNIYFQVIGVLVIKSVAQSAYLCVKKVLINLPITNWEIN
jgi:hypothetical protein